MCEHNHLEVLASFIETDEVWYKCLDCGATIYVDGEEFEILTESSDEIPF